jgi:hypothetical protein
LTIEKADSITLVLHRVRRICSGTRSRRTASISSMPPASGAGVDVYQPRMEAIQGALGAAVLRHRVGVLQLPFHVSCVILRQVIDHVAVRIARVDLRPIEAAEAPLLNLRWLDFMSNIPPLPPEKCKFRICAAKQVKR